MKIISCNIGGIESSYKKSDLLGFIKREDLDIICFQELKKAKKNIEKLPNELINIPNYNSYFFPHQEKGMHGVGIYTKIKPKNIKNGIGVEKFDHEGRTQILDFGEFTLVNVYCPHGANNNYLPKQLEYLDYLKEVILEMNKEKDKIIICGDFNMAHSDLDLSHENKRRKIYGYLPAQKQFIDDLIANNFIDSFRTIHPNSKKYTWKGPKNNWRLDYFFISKNLENYLKKADVLEKEELSDHNPILIELEF